MTIDELISLLSLAVLLLFIVALLYLIVLLFRANRILSGIENLSGTFRAFVAEIVPAIVNVGTIATAIHGVLKALTDHKESTAKATSKTKK